VVKHVYNMDEEKEFDTYSSIRLDKLLNVPDWIDVI
jgi:hypothetical protein